jgi:hypothetical protein
MTWLRLLKTLSNNHASAGLKCVTVSEFLSFLNKWMILEQKIDKSVKYYILYLRATTS